MREILFRGKTTDGRWAEGSLIHAGNYCCILEDEDKVHPMDYPYLDDFLGTIDGKATPVDPKTVGQFTGFLDKNRNRIWEGDIISTRKDGTRTRKLKGHFGVDSEGYPQKIPGYEGYCEYHYPCQIDCLAVVKFSPRHGFYLDGTTMFVEAICNEIVGNIYDNPELLAPKS